MPVQGISGLFMASASFNGQSNILIWFLLLNSNLFFSLANFESFSFITLLTLCSCFPSTSANVLRLYMLSTKLLLLLEEDFTKDLLRCDANKNETSKKFVFESGADGNSLAKTATGFQSDFKLLNWQRLGCGKVLTWKIAVDVCDLRQIAIASVGTSVVILSFNFSANKTFKFLLNTTVNFLLLFYCDSENGLSSLSLPHPRL